MTETQWDLIVIGGGSAGLTAAIMAGEIGARVLLVDKTRLGGDCTWTGCVPSKTFIECARVAHTARHASRFGVDCGEVHVDFPAVMQRVRAVRQSIADAETPADLAHHHVEVAFGGATFIDAHSVRIGASRVEHASHFIIATGSHAAAPPITGLEAVGALTNEQVFDLETQPQRLVVIGGGPIGCELGQAFARLGTQVTLLQHAERLLDREDPDIGAHMAAVLCDDGVELHLNTRAERAERRNGESIVHFSTGGTRGEVAGDAVLVAVGRKANLEGLGLSDAGITVHNDAIAVNDKLQTHHRHIYAVGDCNGGPQFTHWAEHEARLAARNALFRGTATRTIANIPWVTFTDPEVARLGLSEAQARDAGHKPHVHHVPFSKVDRAVCAGAPGGFIRVVAGDGDRILGVHIVGHHAGELLAEWALALDHNLTISDIGGTIHPYPTLSRANRRIADEAFFHHNVAGWKKSLFGTFRGRGER